MLSLIILAILFVAVAAFCLAVSSPAEASPGAHHHQARQHHHASHYVRSGIKESAKSEYPRSGISAWWYRVTGETSRVTLARRFDGMTASQIGLPRSLWCADFINMLERRLGRSGTGSRMAASFASYGTRVSGPQVGAIAVMTRRGGGHVGIVTGVSAEGVIIISGNHNGTVREAVYPQSRIYAYRT